MAKHSQQHPTVPVSAPTSPIVIRSKSDRAQPATPQRAMQRAHRQLQSSPYTPAASFASPYTPLSLRSFSTSTASSLATPSSAAANRRLSLSLSPENSFHAKGRKGNADATDNWRSRAHEHGIRVGLNDDSRFADDEDDGEIDLDTSSFFSTDRALLPAPFLSTQRRARAFTQALPQAPNMSLGPISSPVQMSTPARAPRVQSFTLSPEFLNTPPPNPALLNKFRLRGTMTDPAQTRRRPAFEQVSELCDIDEDEYMPYIEDLSSPTASRIQSQTLPLHFQDPFDMSDVSEMYQEMHSLPVLPTFEPPHAPSRQSAPSSPACSVCGSSSGSLAVLDPCTHPLCSGCLTSALNIVGEKDMECAVCKAKVNDFKLEKLCLPSEVPARASSQNGGGTFFSEPLESGFQDFIDRAQGSSTPVMEVKGGRQQGNSARSGERAVLRIDNVPWDITPPAITAWLKQPVERVHVLLDRKGKTLSHAFVEMASPDAAKAALRTSQNSVLGKGKRARGVTVTRSNQEELMRSLFPSWQGSFDGARPSLAGLDNERVIAALQHGLISDAELKSLLHLIRSPDSPFLKVPSLPFHSLISVLSKIPSDDDSKVFWSGNLRDMLYDITHAAVTTLVAKIDGNPFSDWTSLMTQVVRAAMDCQAFTAEQMSRLSDILEAALPRSSSSPVSSISPCRSSSTPDSASIRVAPLQSSRKGNVTASATKPASYGDLAKEFGVDAQVVEALIKRLSDFP
ncbi:hypothetical protein BDY19DRAFT_149916 [Irpex rosettiformis]|uniref:Uncharacterized protein n=1 Tax=Irpex rosettiformis TaxID=378272 RepID=A0ACB8U3I4_9APHY|nr:hypothetical protein BDY19DRAFT_149916 [Irpex rosettiformis]